jgi:hypothetical protein
MEPGIQENLMHRYLLGDLPESEATVVEEELFSDDERFERMWEIENRLVDGYVRGRLSSEDRRRFESHYLASPVHRQRLAVAQHLLGKADGLRAETAAAAPKASRRARLFEKLGISSVQWQFALAGAMLVFAATSLWLFLDQTRVRKEIAQIRAENEALRSREQMLDDRIADAQGQNEQLAAELERLRSEQNAIAKQSAQQPPGQASRPKIFSFLLSPMLVRSGGKPQAFTIPLLTDLVHLQMRSLQSDARRFQVNVSTVEGRQVWKEQAIKPRIDDSNNAIIIAQIPAGKLATGDYILTLSAVNSRGEREEVNRYFFRVLKQSARKEK